jgi:hypothetical protein
LKTLAYADVTGESAAIVIALQVNICWLQSTVVSLTRRNSCATQIRANPFLRRKEIALSSTSTDGRRPRAQQLFRSEGCVGLLYVAVPWRLYSRRSIFRILALYVSLFGSATPKPGGAYGICQPSN